MSRVVIDTSSLVSFVLTRGEIMRELITAWGAGRYVVLSSPAMRTELARVLARPHIVDRCVIPLSPFLDGYFRYTELVPGLVQLSGVCRDPKDDMFLACAVEGHAQYLVSSDRDLLDMRRYQDVCILNPGQFLVALQLASLSAPEISSRYSSATLAAIRARICLDPDTERALAQAIAP